MVSKPPRRAAARPSPLNSATAPLPRLLRAGRRIGARGSGGCGHGRILRCEGRGVHDEVARERRARLREPASPQEARPTVGPAGDARVRLGTGPAHSVGDEEGAFRPRQRDIGEPTRLVGPAVIAGDDLLLRAGDEDHAGMSGSTTARPKTAIRSRNPIRSALPAASDASSSRSVAGSSRAPTLSRSCVVRCSDRGRSPTTRHARADRLTSPTSRATVW